ncbi:N-acetyl-gamma-glutamyl-phosphate reductase [Streptomyces sp. SPB162]|uniref:N-acetyl-gamma-glutamyl-phosphate reductase n=1 Tax=Streptomyces sp. SPB162 TaxID=2940560 RepID=UPI002404932F|nr:N-acetyl-gamma-glutamyl-phosphate reductase [Streptomyces sp. SPB162]MDF9815303.1 N-acetyl-gamma-glutamyl-phosphate/LysW-gamma-L-alpha-aminoadipyl-6-phosphate reductase [Streptomyces sp. SPB162]
MNESPGPVVRAGIVGASGYIGGELCRILLGHPRLELVAPVSRGLAGKRVDGAHPNLRGLTDLTFSAPDDAPRCDVLFLATPHRETMGMVPYWAGRAGCLVDLSADFRLRDPAVYEHYYGAPHAAPELLPEFVTGLPERFRKELTEADRISVPGCMATAAMLALSPLAAAGLIEDRVTVDGRIGSSGSGSGAGPMNLHAERSGAMRVFAPAGHRHEAEVAQLTGLSVSMSATGVEAVRGAQVLCRATLTADIREPELRRVYRDAYAAEPCVRVVAQRRGLYRLPEPKILSGSNFCDVGFALDADHGQVVAVAALDNLVKGAAGNAVQCVNIRQGWPEDLGLGFPGLHPL